jgi:hypothetical protein
MGTVSAREALIQDKMHRWSEGTDNDDITDYFFAIQSLCSDSCLSVWTKNEIDFSRNDLHVRAVCPVRVLAPAK